MKKKILITFARSTWALDLARKLYAAGHEIYTADSLRFHVSHFSKAIKSSFLVPSPRFEPEKYIEALVRIAHEHKIDCLIPIYEESWLIAKHAPLFPSDCTLFCPPEQLFHTLHHKWHFQTLLKELQIETPKFFLINNQQELSDLNFDAAYALKACYSRASQKVKKITSKINLETLSIDETNPWLAQEWVEGKKYCSYSICHEGKIRASATYPVIYAIDGNSCLTFESVKQPKILEWIENFVRKINYTGQISFDFIESSKTNQLYAIECNPRATSGLHLFHEKDQMGTAFFEQDATALPILPSSGLRQQILTGMLMFGWKKSSFANNTLKKFLKTVCSTKDVVYSSQDLKPFLCAPLVFANLLLKAKKVQQKIPDFFTYDHDWNGHQPL